MSKRVQKWISCLLIVLLLSSSIMASEAYPVHNSNDCDCAESYSNSYILKEPTSEIQKILNDLLATIPKDATIENFQDILSTKFPGVIVIKNDKVYETNNSIKVLEGYTDAEINKINSVIEAITQVSSDQGITSYTIIWKNIEQNEIYMMSSTWCSMCQEFVDWILEKLLEYLFDSAMQRVEEWAIDRIVCAYNHFISETYALVNVEYAPTCSICFSSNNMTWNGYWWCTACNQGK